MKKKKQILVTSALTLSLLGSGLGFQDISHAAQLKGWNFSGNKWHYVQNNGSMTKGWSFINNKWYYFDSNGNMQTGWIQSGGKWYYLENSGAMKTGWVLTGGKWYYLENSGAMKTGWVFYQNNWYYLDKSGAMGVGWIQSGGKWYYLENSGAMKTGWVVYKGTWYYLNNNGDMVESGWKLINSKWYYFYPSGSMASNTTIDGYTIGADGAWLVDQKPQQLSLDMLDKFMNRSSSYVSVKTSQFDKQFGNYSSTSITGTILAILASGRASVDEMKSVILGKADGDYKVTGLYTYETTIPDDQDSYTQAEIDSGTYYYDRAKQNGLFDSSFNGVVYDACRGVVLANHFGEGMKVTRVVITFEKLK